MHITAVELQKLGLDHSLKVTKSTFGNPPNGTPEYQCFHPDSQGSPKSCWLYQLSVLSRTEEAVNSHEKSHTLKKKEHLAISSITFLLQLTSPQSCLIFQPITPSSNHPHAVSNLLCRQLHTNPSM